MSGGSYNYAYSTVSNMAEDFRLSRTPQRRAFAIHLRLVAAAMRAIEWEDSSDSGPEVTNAAITAVLTKEALVAGAVEAVEELQAQLAELLDSLRKE